ncbi:hypothetical protein GCM10010145_47610 [Streptomyces ruber]|uniref:Uncharacterized protein n=2 Tax=Streptomyces TaxID=1883 RepID=A0A918BJP4_9ACTN|nr:hypothetical protein GCM10010145_47610 [Streptomyces ruber]
MPRPGRHPDLTSIGEADPGNGVSTGGVAVIVLDNGRAVPMRPLVADFDTGVSGPFPDHRPAHRLRDRGAGEARPVGRLEP